MMPDMHWKYWVCPTYETWIRGGGLCTDQPRYLTAWYILIQFCLPFGVRNPSCSTSNLRNIRFGQIGLRVVSKDNQLRASCREYSSMPYICQIQRIARTQNAQNYHYQGIYSVVLQSIKHQDKAQRSLLWLTQHLCGALDRHLIRPVRFFPDITDHYVDARWQQQVRDY